MGLVKPCQSDRPELSGTLLVVGIIVVVLKVLVLIVVIVLKMRTHSRSSIVKVDLFSKIDL